MRRIRIAILFVMVLLVALTAGVASVAPAKPGKAPKEIKRSEKLREAVGPSGILVHERRFQRFADGSDDTRASGTQGYDDSSEYVASKLDAAGYDVTVQEFEFPFFRELAPAELEQVSPNAKTYETVTYDYSGSGDVTGDLVPIDVVIPPTPEPSSTSGCEDSDFPQASATEPQVALIQRGTCTFGEKAANAREAGYDAVIIFNEGQPGRQELFEGTLGAPETIPVVGASFADGQELYNADQAGDVVVRVFTSTESEPRTTTNVLADTPTGRPDRVVVVGAHLDSVIEGPGINDNGSGSATILETALQMAKVEKKPVNQVRFAFWGAEELGLLGSDYYVNNLSDNERDDIALNLNFDMLGSPNFVRFVYDGNGSATPDDPDDTGPAGSGEIEKTFNDYYAARNLQTEPTAFDGRSDYGPFIEAGIPAGGLFSGAEGIKTPDEAAVYGGIPGQAYDPCYHQACDDISNLSITSLSQLSDGAAHATLTYALAKDLFVDEAARRGIEARSFNDVYEEFKGPGPTGRPET